MSVKTLYPPTLNSTQLPILSDNFNLKFNITNLNSINEIGGLEYKISNWTNNKEIDRKIINKDIFSQESNVTYYIPIYASGKLNVGSLYKIQIRFISEINSNTPVYSEWSNIMLIKRIELDEIRIVNNRVLETNTTQIFTIETSTNPLFMGTCKFTEQSKEYVDKYKFDLYEIKTDEETSKEYTVFLESSDWQQHNANAESIDEWRFKQILLPSKNDIGTNHREDNHLYKVIYTITTINGYTLSSAPYRLYTIEDNTTETLDSFEFIATIDEENAKVDLKLKLKEGIDKNNNKILGNYIISRLDEQNGYIKREELKYLNINDQIFETEIIFTDYTIESGVRYKYSIQRENYYGLRSPDKFANNGQEIEVNFEHAYLFKDNIQLKIKYNPKISNFKYTTLAQKQDVLSGKYPVISRNKQAYYAEIPIGGLISFQAEDSYDFFKYQVFENENLNGFYYKDELVIPARKFYEGTNIRTSTKSLNEFKNYIQTIDSGINSNNIFIEKRYRDKVLDFLNREQTFLFKSPTEGNFIISLINVSTTPNQQLGRMISEFSATGYEIAENTIENMIKYNIWDRGIKLPYDEFVKKENNKGIAQIADFFTEDINILDYIKEQVYEEIKDGIETSGSYIFDCFTSVIIEAFPRLDLKQKYGAKKNEIEEALRKLNELEEENKKKELEELIKSLQLELDLIVKQMEYFNNVPYYDNLIISIGDKELLIPEGQCLTLSQLQLANISSIKVKTSHMQHIQNSGTPLIINYTYRLKATEMSREGIVQRKEGSFLFGQMAGIFDKQDKMLDRFNPYYDLYKVPRVYSALGDKEEGLIKINSYNNNFQLDNTNMKLYKSLDIYDLIKQECKQQIETWYGINMPYETIYEEILEDNSIVSHKAWTNKTVNSDDEQLCYLNQIDVIYIETTPGTMMTLVFDEEHPIEKKIVVGETGVYKVELEDNLYSIKFDRATYAIINYSATTIQVKKVYEFKEIIDEGEN